MTDSSLTSSVTHELDWVRVTFLGAVGGGALWAVLTVALSLLGHGHPSMALTFGFLFGVSAVVLAAGVLLYRYAGSVRRRSTGAGMALGVLLGWLILVLIVVTGVLPAHFGARS